MLAMANRSLANALSAKGLGFHMTDVTTYCESRRETSTKMSVGDPSVTRKKNIVSTTANTTYITADYVHRPHSIDGLTNPHVQMLV